MNELLPFIAIDFVIVTTISALFWRQSSFFHPLTWYLFFHAYSFSFRAIELYSGKFPMYYGYSGHLFYSAVRPTEFVRGLLVADAALILFALGAALSGTGIKARVAGAFNDKLLKWFLVALLPVCITLLILRRYSADGEELVRGFQLVYVMTIWPIACIALGIARWGFNWFWVALAGAFLFIVGTQGYHRFMAVLPIVMLLGIYLARKRYRWPGPVALALLIAAAIVFPNLKTFGRVYQRSGISAAAQTLSASQYGYNDNTSTRTEMFFDQMAGSLTLADAVESPLLGKSYLAILTLPIPRAFWPGKPTLGATTETIAAPGRPFDQEGRIVTVIGESYINFRYPGILVMLPLLGFALSRFYRKAFSIPQLDPYKLIYIGVMTTYLQVFRDGVPSLVLFSVIAMAPIFIYAGLNRLSAVRGGAAPPKFGELAPAP